MAIAQRSESWDEAGLHSMEIHVLEQPMPSLFDRLRRPSTGSALDPGDRQVMAQLQAAGADLTKPRDTVHWLYFPSQAAAERAGQRLAADGYTIDVAPSAEKDSSQWRVRANHLLVVQPSTFSTVRSLMDQVARDGGGDYDGWEAAARP